MSLRERRAVYFASAESGETTLDATPSTRLSCCSPTAARPAAPSSPAWRATPESRSCVEFRDIRDGGRV